MTYSRGCAETAGLYAFGCQQPTPAPLPDIPATAVLFGFGPDGLLPEGSGGNVGSALDALNQYLACFPQNLCAVAQEGDILYHDGDGLTLVSLNDLITGFLDQALPSPGDFLLNDNGVVGPANFCDSVENCLSNIIGGDGEVITEAGGNLVSQSFEDLLASALGDLLEPGEVLYNDSGVVGGETVCDLVFECLDNNLGAGQIPLGGAPGGVAILCDEVADCLDGLLGVGQVLVGGTGGPTALDLCVEVMNCFDAQFSTTTGEVLYDPGTGLTPTDLCTLVLDCVSNGYGSSNGDVLYDSGGGLAPTSLCNLVTACIASGLGSNTGDVLYNDGTGLVAADLCTLVLDCISSGLLTGSNTYYGTDAAGNAGEYDLCTAVTACLATQAQAAGAGTYYGTDAAGNPGFYDFCTQVADCLANNFNGDPGDISVTNAGGTQEWRTFLDYLNEFYPQTQCDTYLYYDLNGATWQFRNGPVPLPSNPAVDLLPIIPPVNAKGVWEFDKETGCSSLVCSPRQKDLTIQVPGDFPTVQDAMNWLRAKTIEGVVVNLTQADPGFTADQYNGRATVNANGNTIAGVTVSGPTAQLTINDAVLTGAAGNGLFAALGGTVSGNNVRFDSNGANGIYATVGSNVFITGVTSASGNGANGIFSDAGSTVNLGGAIPASNNGEHGVRVTAGAHLGIDGNIQAASNGVHGYFIDQNATLESTGDLSAVNNAAGLGLAAFSGSIVSAPSGTFSNNGASGVALNDSTLAFGSAVVAENNGGNGIIMANNASLQGSAVAMNSNAGNGLQMTGASNVRIDNGYANSNGGTGFYIAETSSVLILGEVQAGFNGQMGVWALRNSTFADYGVQGLYNNNGNIGVYVQDDSHAYVVGATADLNAGSAFYAQDGSQITALNSTATNSGAGFGYTAITLSRVQRGASTASGNALGATNIPLNALAVDGSFMI